jgi:hypothetical protein
LFRALLGSVDLALEWSLTWAFSAQDSESTVIGRGNTVICAWAMIWQGIVITVVVLRVEDDGTSISLAVQTQLDLVLS